MLLGVVLLWVGPPVAAQPGEERLGLVRQELRYQAAGAGEVFLVWGMDGWRLPPRDLWPEGSFESGRTVHTPMRPVDGAFAATLRLPRGNTINYVFRIRRTADWTPVDVWDTGRGRGFRASVSGERISVVSRPALPSRSGGGAFEVWWLIVLGAQVAFLVAALAAKLGHDDRPGLVALGLGALTVVALAVRMWSAWQNNLTLPDLPVRLSGDESQYDDLAVGVLQGRFFPWPGRMPLYPLFVAASYALLGRSYVTILYVQAVVGALAVPLTFALARRFVDAGTALAAAALVTLNPLLILHVGRLSSEVLYTPLLLLTMMAAVWATRNPRPPRFGLMGALLGILTLTRPASALLGIAFFPFTHPRWRRAARVRLWMVAVGAMGLVLLPWSAHNYRAFGLLSPLTVTTTVLWQGSPEYYHLMERRLTLTEIWDRYLNPARNGGKNPYSVEGSRYFNDRALDSIRAEPAVYMRYSLNKAGYFWTGHPAADWPGYAPFATSVWLEYFGPRYVAAQFAGRLLPVAAAMALLLLARRRHLRALLPLLAVCAYFTGVHAALYAEVRYSEPLHPILGMLLAAAFLGGRDVSLNEREALV